ncbi:formylglycine-generating enzyme family protein [Flagellimonas hadalis]|uniref:Formylglycine-generating enzyme family protein n=2 Tax=Flagellimonas hadalis TaxID=2597517 RepID=A0A5N5IQQ8_9FLAO|nr:formylglycine-generating enzyme family protein [Allomuricauda hadalis]
MTFRLKNSKVKMYLTTCFISLNAMAQQDSLLNDFVEIKSGEHHFYISKYAITREQYNDFLELWGEHKNLTDEQGELPVLVNKEDAERYLEHISDTYLTHFRLPSETEWELAAKGTTTPKKAKEIRCVDCTKPNENGLYGMLGNVWEWTSTSEPKENDRYFVIKGGDFQERAKDLSPKTRFVVSKDMEDMNIGFRPVANTHDFETTLHINRANTIVKVLLPNEDITIYEHDMQVEEFYMGYGDTPPEGFPITVDEDTHQIVLCCLQNFEYEQEGALETERITYIGLPFGFDPSQLSLAKELEQLVRQLMENQNH